MCIQTTLHYTCSHTSSLPLDPCPRFFSQSRSPTHLDENHITTQQHLNHPNICSSCYAEFNERLDECVFDVPLSSSGDGKEEVREGVVMSGALENGERGYEKGRRVGGVDFDDDQSQTQMWQSFPPLRLSGSSSRRSEDQQHGKNLEDVLQKTIEKAKGKAKGETKKLQKKLQKKVQKQKDEVESKVDAWVDHALQMDGSWDTKGVENDRERRPYSHIPSSNQQTHQQDLNLQHQRQRSHSQELTRLHQIYEAETRQELEEDELAWAMRESEKSLAVEDIRRDWENGRKGGQKGDDWIIEEIEEIVGDGGWVEYVPVGQREQWEREQQQQQRERWRSSRSANSYSQPQTQPQMDSQTAREPFASSSSADWGSSPWQRDEGGAGAGSYGNGYGNGFVYQHSHPGPRPGLYERTYPGPFPHPYGEQYVRLPEGWWGWGDQRSYSPPYHYPQYQDQSHYQSQNQRQWHGQPREGETWVHLPGWETPDLPPRAGLVETDTGGDGVSDLDLDSDEDSDSDEESDEDSDSSNSDDSNSDSDSDSDLDPTPAKKMSTRKPQLKPTSKPTSITIAISTSSSGRRTKQTIKTAVYTSSQSKMAVAVAVEEETNDTSTDTDDDSDTDSHADADNDDHGLDSTPRKAIEAGGAKAATTEAQKATTGTTAAATAQGKEKSPETNTGIRKVVRRSPRVNWESIFLR